MKIYTKTGDKGTTSLVGGTRIAKSDLRLDAYGTIDELNSWLGFILSCGVKDDATLEFISALQNKLFDLGCALATEKDAKWQPTLITDADIKALENEIDRIEATLPCHDKFILPGGCQPAAAANIARTVCRRAERMMVGLPEDACPGQTVALGFVNRLSDYLFVLGRHLNHLSGEPESFWQQNAEL